MKHEAGLSTLLNIVQPLIPNPASIFVLEGAPMIRDHILRSSRLNPSGEALIVGEQSWTYDDLEQLARQWAAGLMRVTDGRPQRVGIFGRRSTVAYAAVLAIIFAGAAFVPLNPRFPAERTRRMIESGKLDAIFVDEEAIGLLAQVLAGLPNPPPCIAPATNAATAGHPLALDAPALRAVAPLADLPPVSAADLAYLLFTSGSTGEPKGVPITQANLLHFFEVNSDRYGIGPGDRLSQTFDQTFDLSIFDLVMSWGTGATLCGMQAIQLVAPASFVAKNQLTVWFSVPSLAINMQRHGFLKPNSMPSLRLSLFCGEPLPMAVAEAWQKAAPNSIVENLYGPTELTIACSAYRWDPVASPAECQQGIVPVGRFYPGHTVRLVDEGDSPVAEGEAGELCVAGAQQFPGYWNAPELTERATLTLPHDGAPTRFYRTGDIMRLLPSGNHVFVGRKDHQIKFQGYRIELAEIEAALRRCGCVEAVALPAPSAHHPSAILACVTAAASPADLSGALREILPPYMVPAEIYVLDEMPLNANGKIDRKALHQHYAQVRAAAKEA